MRPLRSFLLAATAAVGLAGTASAQSFMADPIYDSPMFNFEGFYAGVIGGGVWLPVPGLVGSLGIAAGANFSLSESFLAGLEFQGEGMWNGAGWVGGNGLVLGRVGGYVTQDIMAYAALGGGLINNAGAYAIGGGVEGPLMNQVGVRGEVLATGPWGAAPSGAKATLGLLWHMN